jgi:hypothetical protein
MQYRAPLLDVAIATPADDLAAMHENRTDWDSAFAALAVLPRLLLVFGNIVRECVM